MGHKTCIILRGLPGSGKSTFARKIDQRSHVVCSADDYFLRLNGRWVFDPSRLPDAHAHCLRTFIDATRRHHDVLVDNTNTTNVEVAPYAQIALAYGYKLRVLLFESGTPEECAARNVHGVPLEVVRAMAARIEQAKAEYPPYWPRMEVVR